MAGINLSDPRLETIMRTTFFALAVALAMPLFGGSLEDHLRQHGRPPLDYLLSKVDGHRIVIAGENHWQRRDAELIRDVVPELRRRNVALAMEFFRASSQGEIDALLAAPEWDEDLANRIMRAGDWPYVQYREILREAWKANRTGEGPKMKVIALGPPEDFRKRGIRYDEFMASRVRDYATDDEHRILVYCGMHHAFTRFLQVERMRDGRASEFMDRTGNILWRRFGEDVFLIALHKAEGCGGWGHPYDAMCAPLGGAIDCAAARSGGAPVGFDILGSPLAEMKFPETSFYAIAHPLLRMIDYADGYIWQEPVDAIRMVELIPLEAYDPAGSADAATRSEWEARARDLANPKERASWKGLPEWRAACAPGK